MSRVNSSPLKIIKKNLNLRLMKSRAISLLSRKLKLEMIALTSLRTTRKKWVQSADDHQLLVRIKLRELSSNQVSKLTNTFLRKRSEPVSLLQFIFVWIQLQTFNMLLNRWTERIYRGSHSVKAVMLMIVSRMSSKFLRGWLIQISFGFMRSLTIQSVTIFI